MKPTEVSGQTKPFVVPLWKDGAPGFEARRNEPEIAKDWWVSNINNPSLTVYMPERPTGAAVVICPGGGHRLLVIIPEGRDPAVFLNSIGVTAIVLKYRLFREEHSPYTPENVKQDVFRALRVVRSHAQEWHIDPSRIGMLGFSAGASVAAFAACSPGNGDTNAPDPIDRLDSRPNFQMLVYPGAPPLEINAETPPTFMVVAGDDTDGTDGVVQFLEQLRKSNVSVEAHIFAHGEHAFNMGSRSKLRSIKTWPDRMADWLIDNKWLEPNQK